MASHRFEARFVHENSMVTDPIIITPAKTTMNAIWIELFRASRESNTFAGMLQSGIEKPYVLLQETSARPRFRNKRYTQIAWENTREFAIWHERNASHGSPLKVEFHTRSIAWPERVDGTVEPEERPDYREKYIRFAVIDAGGEDEDEGGVRPPSNEWDEEGEEEEGEEWDGPATFTFLPEREPIVQPAAINGNKRARDGDEEGTKKKVRFEEDVEMAEAEEALGQISMASPAEEVGFGFGPNGMTSLAFRPR